MADSIDVHAPALKKYKYVAPTPPITLIDNTCFTIDFADRKFIHIGLDPSSDFNVVIHVITASRHICITYEVLKRIFTTMGHILSVILDTPTKARSTIFLKDDSTLITKMVYRGENNLVMESKNHAGCRVLLNRENLLVLQDLESCILQTVTYKSTIIRQTVMTQIAQMHEYLHKERFHGMQMIFDEVKTVLGRCNITPTTELNFISQLKLIAAQQITERWYGYDEVDSKVIISIYKISILSTNVFIFFFCSYSIYHYRHHYHHPYLYQKTHQRCSWILRGLILRRISTVILILNNECLYLFIFTLILKIIISKVLCILNYNKNHDIQ